MKLRDSIESNRCYIIAEIGANHCGGMATARQMVETAAECGVDAVKLQKRDVTVNVPADWSRAYDGPNSYGATYLDHRRALELDIEQHYELAAMAHSFGLEYGLSCWDVESVNDVVDGGFCDWLKVASATLTDDAVLDRYYLSGLPSIMSIGMSTHEEVASAAVRLGMYGDGIVHMLVCTSAYPCRAEDVHLARLQTLRDLFPCAASFGVSGHWNGIAIDIGAVAMGARILERHFTLDRTMKGTDHAASLEPQGLDKLVRDVRAFEVAVGDPGLRVLPCEESARAKLRVKL